jgi:hypothetical protein
MKQYILGTGLFPETYCVINFYCVLIFLNTALLTKSIK